MPLRHVLTAAAATAAVGASALTPAVSATQAPALKVTGAYAYIQDLGAPSNQKFVRVVFRTRSELPRRSDGSIQAGVAIDGVSHSLGTAKRGTRCYAGAAEIKGGSIATLRGGKVVRKGAKIGRTFTVKVSTRDGRSVTKHLKLRAARAGDDTGKPLGC
jgi:hypothetical protein